MKAVRINNKVRPNNQRVVERFVAIREDSRLFLAHPTRTINFLPS
jgi:hypothetical protein